MQLLSKRHFKVNKIVADKNHARDTPKLKNFLAVIVLAVPIKSDPTRSGIETDLPWTFRRTLTLRANRSTTAPRRQSPFDWSFGQDW